MLFITFHFLMPVGFMYFKKSSYGSWESILLWCQSSFEVDDKKIIFVSSLRGAAKFDKQDGLTVLYLDGTPGTYAETPALPFHQTDLTIAVWIKRFPSPNERQMIYGDWSQPHQFRFDVMTDGRLCVDVRRESLAMNSLLNFCTPWL